MSIYVVWVDRENAKLFRFSNEKMERSSLQARHTDHHTRRFDGMDLQRQEQIFFSEVVANLSEVVNIVILGPGVAKHHFYNYLTEHFPSLARKVVACEAVDHPTDSQVAAMARKFFHFGEPASASGV